MRNKKYFAKLIASGIWIQPIAMTALIKYINAYKPRLLRNPSDYAEIAVIACIPTLFVVMNNVGKPKAEEAITGKEKAMYPPVKSTMLYKSPKGVLLGKDRRTGKYVCKNLSVDGHILLIGGSGSGKSSCFAIPALLLNDSTACFCIDIKGELSYNTSKLNDRKVLKFDPSDRSQCGYNPLFAIGKNSKSQDILETMQVIAFSLIPKPPDVKDPFWINSARNMFIGFFVYFYRKGIRVFVSIVDEVLSRPAKEIIKEIMDKAKPSSIEYKYIVQFSDMDEETIGGIVAEMNNHIIIFANDQDIRYAFKDNPHKMHPLLLENGCKEFLSIKEDKLTAYYDVLQLIINQTLACLEKRPENSRPIIFLIDEMPRIVSEGKINRLLDAARTLRSRKVCLFLITQSTEALMTAYTENEVADLMSNCAYKIILSASSVKTQKSVCEWAGKYLAKVTSWSGTGKNAKINTSYQEKDIVTPNDLLTLDSSGEAILITPNGYARVQKVPYYKDDILHAKNIAITRYNNSIRVKKGDF